ncbi:protein kish-B isoform X1 [Marmota marmota marmota]|uniref:protein kish-B isoform X1 n=1 Tax=Marmota marmota marmota TaxID=9994 RepID=UPI0020923C02|nr:protein kish-B isoform X1 [Marmota marmota marmota]
MTNGSFFRCSSRSLSPSPVHISSLSVLLGWDSGVWFALCLHLCLLQESTSSQNLAAIREEGSLGCVLQSCCDWNQAACCCGNRLHRNGLLCLVCKMNYKIPNSSTANQGDRGEEPVGGLDPV